MKTIVIGASRNRQCKVGSLLIQWHMGTNYSHVYFKFQEELYTDATVFHAVGKGMQYVSYTNFLEHNIPVHEFELIISDEIYAELMQDCHKNSGKVYGFLQNLGIFLVDTWNKLPFKKIHRNPIDDGVVCSEWTAWILEDCYGKWTDKDYNLVKPIDIVEYLLKKVS
jgi:hypothetical protein